MTPIEKAHRAQDKWISKFPLAPTNIQVQLNPSWKLKNASEFISLHEVLPKLYVMNAHSDLLCGSEGLAFYKDEIKESEPDHVILYIGDWQRYAREYINAEKRRRKKARKLLS